MMQDEVIRKEVDQVLAEHVEKWVQAAQWVKFLVVGAFALGGWVMSLQLATNALVRQQQETAAQVKALERDAAESKTKWSVIEAKLAALAEDTREIKEAVKAKR